jgi:hypothetical protein
MQKTTGFLLLQYVPRMHLSKLQASLLSFTHNALFFTPSSSGWHTQTGNKASA